MTVTEIRRLSSEKCTIILDNGEEVASSYHIAEELRLFEGKNMDGEQLAELKLLSVRYFAREKALEMISRRQMSSGELRKKLLEKAFSEDTADYCVEWILSNRFLDDARYAEAVARHYSKKGYGAGKIRAEFSKRLISRELWEDALESLPEEDDALDRLLSAKLNGNYDSAQVSKACASLYRRGFSWDQIREALHRLEEEQ